MEKNDVSYDFKELNDSNIEDLCTSFNSVRKKNKSLSYFTEKYDSSWIGQKIHLGYLIYNKDRAIGFCGSTIYKLNNNQKSYVFGQLGDLFIDSSLRGKGIFQKTLTQLELSAKENQIDAVFVFPNRNAQSIFEKAQWDNIGNFVTYSFDVKTYPLLKLLNKLGKQELFFYFGKLFGSTEFSKIEKKNISTDKMTVVHDELFFKYKKYKRFLFHKYKNIEFLWNLSDGIIINSLQVESEEELKDLINFLKGFCFIRGIHSFKIICHDRSSLSHLLSKKYKGVTSLPILIKSFNSEIDVDSLEFEGIDRNSF